MKEMNKKHHATDFLKWCNERVYRPNGNDIGMMPRAIAQAPDYDTYIIIDERGRSVLGEGVYISVYELYDYWISCE